MSRELKGRHVLAIVVTAFTIIVGANMAMLLAATGSFPGLVVSNSYVASQKWNDRTASQAALGWTASARIEGAVIIVTLRDRSGRPVTGQNLTLAAGRPSDARTDQILTLSPSGPDYRAAADLSPGRWRLAIEAGGEGEAKGESDTAFRQTVVLTIPGHR